MQRFLTCLVLSLIVLAFPMNSLRAEGGESTRREEVIDVVNQLFIQTDAKNWKAVQNLFTDKVQFDMTSLAGGKPSQLSGAQIAEAWKNGLASVQAIHHQVGNFVVSFQGPVAKVFANGIATHYKPQEAKKVTWFVGTYDLSLVRVGKTWKIDGFKFNSKYVD